MTSRPAGLIFDFAAQPTAAARAHDSVVLGIVGSAANATAAGGASAAKYGEVYELNSL